MATALDPKALGQYPHYRVIFVDSDELIDASTTQTIDLCTLKAGAVVESCWVEVRTPFTDAGSISACTVQVGSTGDPNSFATAYDLFGTTAGDRSEAKGVWEAGSGLALKALFTATGANLGDGADTGLDAGAIAVHVKYRVYPAV